MAQPSIKEIEVFDQDFFFQKRLLCDADAEEKGNPITVCTVTCLPNPVKILMRKIN